MDGERWKCLSTEFGAQHFLDVHFSLRTMDGTDAEPGSSHDLEVELMIGNVVVGTRPKQKLFNKIYCFPCASCIVFCFSFFSVKN